MLLHRPQPGNVGVGYWVVGTARGHGFATHAVRLATDWALELDQIERIEAWVESDNVPSRRVVESVGFELEGRLRNFLAFPTRRADALSYSRIPE